MTIYSPDTLFFDGTEFMNRLAGGDGRLDGVVATKVGTLSLWIRRDDGGGNLKDIFNNILTTSGAGAGLKWTTTDLLELLCENSTTGQGPNVINLRTSVALPLGSYFHYMASWDSTSAARNLIFIGDVDDTNLIERIDDTIAYEDLVNDYLVGTLFQGSPDKWPGAICDLWFTTKEFFDLSIEANRRKFIDDNGNPVYLGADGTLPTGTAPDVYLSGNAQDQGLNGGTGGDFVSSATQVPDETLGPVVVSPGNAPVPYLPEGILFDGTTDFQLRGGELQSLADGKAGTVSAWIRVDAGDGVAQIFLAHDTIAHFEFGKLDTNRFYVRGTNAIPTQILLFEGTTSILAGAGYHHVLASWDTEAAGPPVKIYVDDIDVTSVTNSFDEAVAWSGGNWAVGARADGTDKFPGAMSDLYFIDRFFDLTVEANRRKFIDSSGNPVFLGEDGSIPTGTFPSIYQPGSFLDQGFNGGRGGDFVSQGVQVPGETPGPVQPSSSDAEDTMRHLARRTARFHRFFRG